MKAIRENSEPTSDRIGSLIGNVAGSWPIVTVVVS